ncbi:fungal-specific transcription factor [Thermothelomyces heterothallicus CBS 203.75]
MERPPQLPTLGQPPALSIAAISVPGSVSASTIYVSPEATGHQQHQLRQPHHPHHQVAQPDPASAPPRRGPKRAERGETGVAEESPVIWGTNSGLPAKTNGESRNGNGPSSGLGTSPEGRDSSTASPAATTEQPKKKQKRNKPTLSCFECVERKTKCDRGRPHCLACIKRQTNCEYAHVANLLEETTRSATNGRRMTRPPKKRPGGISHVMPNAADRGFNVGRLKALGSVATSTGLLSNVPYSAPGASNVFGIGSEHPFANYWTCEGGLPEVISVLPDKLQADILLNRYFECVDPVYPMLHRQTFYADYEHFWSLSRAEKDRSDAAFVALIFVMLALGTQFVTSTNPAERKQTAEFYASASNQALRMCSYLSTASIRTIQAMVLITYFLINDNHASDGWAFAGILMRQAYAMGLHRDPNIVVPDASPFEKQQRRKVWQAVLLQDTFLTVLLSLPPNATHTDVNVDDLIEDDSSIASDDPTDTAYIRGSWTLANLVQETICSPRSLDVPICTTARHKSKLIGDFRAVYRSFPDVFRSWDPDALAQLALTNKRVVRQTLFLTSNYFHNLMLVHASESPDVPVNVRGTLEAAHDAITAFFVLFALFEDEARVWWVFNHRAFLEALCIGNVLREVAREPGSEETMAKDPLFVRARADIHRMIQIMQVMSEGEQGSQTARTRVQVLSEFLI